MGDFRVVIDAVGGHGCDREALAGDPLKPACDNPACPDCMVRRFVAEMAGKMTVKAATLEHWPGTGSEVLDDVLRSTRLQGSFKRSV